MLTQIELELKSKAKKLLFDLFLKNSISVLYQNDINNFLTFVDLTHPNVTKTKIVFIQYLNLEEKPKIEITKYSEYNKPKRIFLYIPYIGDTKNIDMREYYEKIEKSLTILMHTDYD